MTTMSIRPDAETAADVAYIREHMPELRQGDLLKRSIQTLARSLRDAEQRAEADRLRNDPVDLAEVRAIQAEMESLRAW